MTADIPAWVIIMWLAFTFWWPYEWTKTFKKPYWQSLAIMLVIQYSLYTLIMALAELLILLGVGA